MLLHKGQDKPRDAPTSYRPISLLNGAGKLFERMLLCRLEKYSECSLSPRQYGFRQRRSTMDAIAEVVKIAKCANSGPTQNRDLCAVVTLDVKNAFNSAPWNLIDDALLGSCVPLHLVNVLRSYMSNRVLMTNRRTDSISIPVSCGVPQGSVLGPTLWNLFYDGVLRLPVPSNVRLIAFADDVAIAATAHNSTLLEDLVNPVFEKVNTWMNNNGLTIAPEKSECVILTGKYGQHIPKLSVNGCQIMVKKEIRYLGVQLDTRLSFVGHAIKVSMGAKKGATALGRLMPNVGGPSYSKRQLLMSVVHNRLLYGAQIWADSVVGTRKAVESLTQAQRIAALRIARCYKTVSDMASLVLAKLPPVHLLAVERQTIASNIKMGIAYSKLDARKETILRWQTIWDTTTKGEWTRRLIPDIRRWLDHGPRSISFNMAQVLSNHGCFQKYLWSKGRAHHPSSCTHCNAATDTAEHTLFECSHWEEERRRLTQMLRRQPGPDDVQDLLCGPILEQLPADRESRHRILQAAKKITEAFIEMVENIMSTKQRLERERQRAEVLQIS